MHPPTGTHSALKLAILRSKIEKKILWRGHSTLPRPLLRGDRSTIGLSDFYTIVLT